MFMRQKRNKTELLIWTAPRHTDHIRSVQTAAQRELTRADVFTQSMVYTHWSRNH